MVAINNNISIFISTFRESLDPKYDIEKKGTKLLKLLENLNLKTIYSYNFEPNSPEHLQSLGNCNIYLALIDELWWGTTFKFNELSYALGDVSNSFVNKYQILCFLFRINKEINLSIIDDAQDSGLIILPDSCELAFETIKNKLTI